jgi:hypothetical protein
LDNQILLGGFVINMQRKPNDDPKNVHHKDQATVIYMDSDCLMQPVHAAKVPLNLLDRPLAAKICQPVDNVNARWAI